MGNLCTLISNPKLGDLLSYITCIINKSVFPLIFTIAVVVFVWGVVQYVLLGADDESKRTKGRQFMVWGILALSVMISVWGLVKIVTNTFNVSNPTVPNIPQVPQ